MARPSRSECPLRSPLLIRNSNQSITMPLDSLTSKDTSRFRARRGCPTWAMISGSGIRGGRRSLTGLRGRRREERRRKGARLRRGVKVAEAGVRRWSSTLIPPPPLLILDIRHRLAISLRVTVFLPTHPRQVDSTTPIHHTGRPGEGAQRFGCIPTIPPISAPALHPAVRLSGPNYGDRCCRSYLLASYINSTSLLTYPLRH